MNSIRTGLALRRCGILLPVAVCGLTSRVTAVTQDPGEFRVVSTPRILPVWMAGAVTFHVTPEVRFRVGRLEGDVSSLFGWGQQEPRRTEGQAVAAFGLPVISALRVEAEANAFQTGHGPDIRAHGVEGAVRLMRQDKGGSVWIGGSLVSSWDDENTSNARTLLGGFWKALGQTGLGIAVRAVEYDEEVLVGRDTTYQVLGFPFTSHRTELITFNHYYMDAELIASQHIGAVAVHLDAGGRLTRRSIRERRTWIRGGVEIPLLRDVALQVAAGQRPNVPELRIESGSFISLGLAIELGKGDSTSGSTILATPGPRDPSVELRALQDESEWELVVRNVPGESVEIMGDPTNWSPVRMTPVSTISWRTVLVMRPGTYRVNMRVDGGVWRELPGCPTAKDEFGGVVGVIVIEEPN